MEKTKLDTSARSCTNCDNCGSTLAAGRTITMICRKKPPSVSCALLQGPEGLIWNSVTSWPVVTDADWCKDGFEPKLN